MRVSSSLLDGIFLCFGVEEIENIFQRDGIVEDVEVSDDFEYAGSELHI